MLPSDLVETSLKWSAKSEVVLTDRDNFIGFNGPHHPIREDHFAVIEAPLALVLHDKSTTRLEHVEEAGLTGATRFNICLKNRSHEALEGLLKTLVFSPVRVAVGGNHQLTS